MKFLLDENFGLSWVPVLQEQGWIAVPWVSVGARGRRTKK